ncbi:MAG: hypothetical protein PVF49_02225 [Anaerolineales bacterium]|jgi:hypothetical protein
MIDRFQAVLDDMDNWLAKAGSGETTPLPRDELIQWHIALTRIQEESLNLQRVSQAAVDAFLLRPPKSASQASSRTAPGRSTGQRFYQRLAETMAELEKVLAQLEAD